jgi:hypothetical protein
MPSPLPSLTSLSIGTAALRALTEMLAGEYAPTGLHVATVTVAVPVAPGSEFDPDRIAQRCWRVHQRPADQWETQVLFSGENPTSN